MKWFAFLTHRNLLRFFDILPMCHGETLVKLLSASHKYNVPDSSLPWYSQDIQYLKTCKLFSQNYILGLSH